MPSMSSVEADEQAELGDRLDLAFDDACPPDDWRQNLPGIVLGLFEAEAEMRRLLESTSSTCTSTSVPGMTILDGATFFFTQLISLTWTRPSTPGSSSTKAP